MNTADDEMSTPPCPGGPGELAVSSRGWSQAQPRLQIGQRESAWRAAVRGDGGSRVEPVEWRREL